MSGGRLYTVAGQCLMGVLLLQFRSVVGQLRQGNTGVRACSVPEPGLSWLPCEYDIDAPLENIPFTRNESVRWNSELQFRVGLPADLFNATVYLTNPVMGNISSVINQCASVGRSLATGALLRTFWELYTEYPGIQAIHPWFKNYAWDGHHGPASSNGDSQSCVGLLVAGRATGRTQPLSCSHQDVFAVCASCKAPLRWDPGITLWKSGNFPYLEGACAATCPAGFHDGEGACVPCMPGRHQPAAGLEPACQPCPPGTVTAGYQSAACDPCPPGSFQARAGQTRCEECPANSYQNGAGQAGCSACPPNRPLSPPGSETQDACLSA